MLLHNEANPFRCTPAGRADTSKRLLTLEPTVQELGGVLAKKISSCQCKSVSSEALLDQIASFRVRRNSTNICSLAVFGPPPFLGKARICFGTAIRSVYFDTNCLRFDAGSSPPGRRQRKNSGCTEVKIRIIAAYFLLPFSGVFLFRCSFRFDRDFRLPVAGSSHRAVIFTIEMLKAHPQGKLNTLVQ